MKLTHLILAVAVTSPALIAQQQEAPKMNAAQEQTQLQINPLLDKEALLYEKLHGITEFQQFIEVEQRLAQLRNQQASQSAAITPAPASASPSAAPPAGPVTTPKK